MVFDYLIKGGLVVSGSGIRKVDVGIRGEKIVSVEVDHPSKGARQTIDASGKYVMPGILDVHAHPVYRDDAGSLSFTAIYGGITTLIHYAYAEAGMKLFDTVKELKEDALGKSYLDFGIHATLMDPGSQIEEIPKVFDLGVTSFKMFMAFPRQKRMADDYQLTAAMDVISECGGLAMVHAENGLVIDYLEQRSLKRGENQKEVFLKNRPDYLEAEAIFRAISIAAITNCPLYIVHLSTAKGVVPIAQAKTDGQVVFAETCPQYLTLTDADVQRLGALAKIAPPLRTEKDRLALFEAIKRGTIDVIATDHGAKMKKTEDPFFEAAFGSPQAETMLTVTYDEGVNKGRLGICKLVQLFSENPAKIFGLYPKKGVIQKGSDADLILFDPNKIHAIQHKTQHSNAPYTLYEGRRCLGMPIFSMQRGKILIESGEMKGKPGHGEFLPTKVKK
ncbi:MAG: dihydropyrimidinase [Candidatus Hodarchaeota archaeon]